MRCPFCQSDETKVLDSRQIEAGTAIRRRRECEVCSRRFTTYEKYEDVQLIVVKKGGTRESFSRQKIMNGLLKACEKRPVSTEQLENVVSDIERELRDMNEREVDSNIIGEAIMNRLFEIDEIAYIRFASVYRQFRDIERFMEELDQLVKNKSSK
ncbi:Transcriptional repressor nrdR [Syntrophobotulus glycolicus DSM 8271]|uniref:Transcriptional repressor NrdR n=1 Tax=Syntrophobotulus glycolicus (strain DSM 8271 / FlGlyR) TaxID=645991 RepID=F0SXT9_SYNGF|nr:transcriptional regulator NrdR [Syntrophobotulus glycolicus]ADY57000.1 Transcriptional repressor nrdR [Syntrophobotulus glycolicus DSM 8271]